MENLPLVKISDINLAATLLCCEYDVRGIDPTNPRRVYFYFIESDELRKTIEEYWRGEVLVNPKEHANYRRELLDRIHQGT